MFLHRFLEEIILSVKSPSQNFSLSQVCVDPLVEGNRL